MTDSKAESDTHPIIMMLAKELRVDPERALDLFYSTDVCRQLSDPKTGLQLMSDGYVLEDVLSEIRTNRGKWSNV